MMDLRTLCKLLSDYFDAELEADICREIEELIEEDFFCQVLFNTFNKTLELCEALEREMEVPEDVHIRLYEHLRIELRRK